MIRRTAILPVLAGLIVVMGLGACTLPSAGRSGGATALGDTGGVVSGDGVSCSAPDSMSSVPTRTVSAEFVAVSATRCLLGIETVAGDGEWFIVREQEVRADLSGLTTQLRKPDEKATGDLACPGIAYGQIVITLVDAAGRSIVPSIPRTACLAPMPSVVQTIRDLPWQTVRTSKVRQVRSQLEVSTNCSKSYKPVIDIQAADGRPRTGPTAPVFPVTTYALQICRYDLNPKDTISVGTASFQIGTLVSAASLQGAALTEALATMHAAPPGAGTCSLPQAPFAVLYPVDGSGPFVAVELGGCHRLLDGEGHLRQLDPAFTLPG